MANLWMIQRGHLCRPRDRRRLRIVFETTMRVLHPVLFSPNTPTSPAVLVFALPSALKRYSYRHNSGVKPYGVQGKAQKNRGICGYITNIIVLSLLRIWKAQGLDVLRQKDRHITQMTRRNSSLWRSLLDL